MGASAMSLVHGSVGTSANAASSDTYRQLAIFGDIFERVRAQYVTPPEDAKLIESAINGMLTSLDPHSSYLNPDAAQDMRVQTRGEFGGLGIEVTMEDDLVGDLADRGHARRTRRRHCRRLHRRDRRRGSARHDALRRGRPHARRGQHARSN
jgi:C-terminal processing protease CtpA/Prc